MPIMAIKLYGMDTWMGFVVNLRCPKMSSSWIFGGGTLGSLPLSLESNPDPDPGKNGLCCLRAITLEQVFLFLCKIESQGDL